MNTRAVLYVLGRLLVGLAVLLGAPTAVAFAHEGPDAWPFVGAIALVGTAGVALIRAFAQRAGFSLERNDAFLLVTLAWLAATAVGALPWILTKGPLFALDAVFEGAAGFTTTGASILTDIEGQPAGLLFWRSMTQWLGGMGIIVAGIAILPRLSTGGVALLSAEAPGPIQEKLTPRIARTAKALWGIYALLTALEIGALWLAGMAPLDAVNHAFATLSTGGFSTRNAGVAAFESPLIEMIIVGFMFAAGINFAAFFHALRGRMGPLLRDPEIRLYAGIVLLASAAIAVDLSLAGESPLDALRLALFQTVSVQTTTGFGTADFDAWPVFSKAVLFCLFFVGGCAGSTSGSVKVVRIQILLKKALADVQRMARPHALIPIRQGPRVIPPEVVTGVTSFVVLFLLLFTAGGVCLTVLGLDAESAFSASAACLANVGPGFGSVGPACNFAEAPALAKALLTVLMIVGRLELYTVLVLLWLIPRRRRRRRPRPLTGGPQPASPPPAILSSNPQPFASARYPKIVPEGEELIPEAQVRNDEETAGEPAEGKGPHGPATG